MMEVTINNKKFLVDEIYQPVFGHKDIPSKRSDSYRRLETIIEAERAFNQNKLLEKEQNILDFGCNNGFFLFELSKLMKQESNLYGIDSKEEYLNIAKEVKSEFNLNNIFFHQSDNLDFGKDIKIDTYILLSVLHHINPSVIIRDDIKNKLNEASTIYIEPAHHCEYPDWSRNLIPKNPEEHPYFFWKTNLESQFPEFTVRLIDVNRTHLGSFRPMFLLKKKINKSFVYNETSYNIYDEFNAPFIWHPDNTRKYYFAESNNQKYFIKIRNNGEVKIKPYTDSLLLMEIVRLGLLPWYNRKKIKTQLEKIKNLKHPDKELWNIFVDENSDLVLIDPDDKSMMTDEQMNAHIQSMIYMI